MSDTDFLKKRTAVIQDITQLAKEKYGFPEIGDKIASQIQAKLESGK